MRDAAYMPKLHKDASACRVHRLGDGFPGLHLRIVPDAGYVGIALCLVADGRGLADDEGRTLLRVGALRVVAGHTRMCQGAGRAVAR